jgi:hypothetical protein
LTAPILDHNYLVAIVRCQKHKPEVTKGEEYVGEYDPAGHPASGLICGRKDCTEPGGVWLTAPESQAYESGERIFELSTRAAKVRVH